MGMGTNWEYLSTANALGMGLSGNNWEQTGTIPRKKWDYLGLGMGLTIDENALFLGITGNKLGISLEVENYYSGTSWE